MQGRNKYPFSKVVTLMHLGSKIALSHGSQLYIELRMTLGWPLPKMFKWVYVVALVGHGSKKKVLKCIFFCLKPQDLAL